MANIEFYLKPKSEIDEIPVREGNILFDTTNKNLLVDENGTRESYGGGGGGTDIVDLTRDEYDDLPDTKLTDGKMYHVTDQDVTPTSANMVTLVKDGQQTNVQAGFDGLNDQLSGVRFGIDGDGNRGYYGADDSFIPFSKELSYKAKSYYSNGYGICDIEYKNTEKYSKLKIKEINISPAIGYNNLTIYVNGTSQLTITSSQNDFEYELSNADTVMLSLNSYSNAICEISGVSFE